MRQRAIPRNLGFLSTTSLISPTSSMLVYRTAMWTLSGSRTTCCNTSDSVGLFSLKDKTHLHQLKSRDPFVKMNRHTLFRRHKNSRIDAFSNGRHDEENSLCHLPRRVPVLQRGIQLRTKRKCRKHKTSLNVEHYKRRCEVITCEKHSMDPTRKMTSLTRSETLIRNSPKSSVSSGIPSC